MIAYLVTNTVNGKRYIGITKDGEPSRRWQRHIRQARSRSSRDMPTVLHRAIVKHGVGAFTIEPIASARTWEELQATERILIAQYNTMRPYGYNLTLGGEGSLGFRHKPESNQKNSEATKLRLASPEGMARHSLGQKQRSPETRIKQSEAMKAQYASKEARIRHGELIRRTVSSLDIRAKMSKSAKKRTHTIRDVRQSEIRL